MQTAYEYALRNSEEPSLGVALRICNSYWEMCVLIDCLRYKRSYEIVHRLIAISREENRPFWLDSAEYWGQKYLDSLKKLEKIQQARKKA